MIRKVCIVNMLREYKAHADTAGDASREIYGRSILQRVVKLVKREEQKRRASADYMLGAFAYDNIENVQRIVKQEVECLSD